MIARIALLPFLALALRVAAQPCTGDCDGDLQVTVDEIVTAAIIALGDRPLEDCTSADADGDEAVTVDEIIQAVNHALDGCPPPAATPTASTTTTPTTTARPSPSPPPTLTATPTTTIRLEWSSAAGAPAAQVSVELKLTGSNGLVVAASSDLLYDASEVAVVRDAQGIGCALAFSDPPGSGVERLLLLNVLPAGGTRERLRIGIVNSVASQFPDTPLPDGPLVRCQFAISASASAGEKTLTNIPDVTGADDLSLPVAGGDGVITVLG